MRKLAVSFVTLTSLTACSQGDELATQWSFELPDNLASDEQFSRFGEQLASPGYDRLASANPFIDEATPRFTPRQSSPQFSRDIDAELEAEFEAIENSLTDDQDYFPDPITPTHETSSDLSIDELVQLNFPQQRGPRPNPLDQIQFSERSPVADNHQIERILSAAHTPTPSLTQPEDRPSPMAVPVPASAFATDQQPAAIQIDLRDHIGGPVLPPPIINLSLHDNLNVEEQIELIQPIQGEETETIDEASTDDSIDSILTSEVIPITDETTQYWPELAPELDDGTVTAPSESEVALPNGNLSDVGTNTVIPKRLRDRLNNDSYPLNSQDKRAILQLSKLNQSDIPWTIQPEDTLHLSWLKFSPQSTPKLIYHK